MKKTFKKFFVFFFLFLTVFSWQTSNLFAVDNVQPLGSGEEEKSPWLQIFEKCPEGSTTGECLALKGAAVGWTSLQDIGSRIDGIEKTVENVKGLMSMSLADILAEIFLKLAEIVGDIVGKMIYLTVFLMSPDTFQYATFPAVQAGFYVSLQIANALLAIGMVILADKFILGSESYGNLKSLTGYLVTALIINFSLTFASYGIGISNFLTITFLDGAASGGEFQGAPSLDYATRQNMIIDNFSATFGALINDKGDPKLTAAANMSIILVFIIFSLFFIVLLAAIAVSLVMRVIGLWTLLMVLPLAIAADTVFGSLKLPGVPVGDGNFKKWLGSFIKWLSFAPIMAGVIFFVFLVMGQMGEAFAIKEYDPNISMLMTTFGETLGLLLALVMLYKGYEFANSSSTGMPKFMDNAVKGVLSYDSQKGLNFLGKRSATKFGYGLADSKAGVWAQAHIPVVGNWLTSAGMSAKKLREEDQQKFKTRWDHIYDAAKGEDRKKAVAEEAVFRYKETRDPRLLGFIAANDDAKKEFFDDYIYEKSGSINKAKTEQEKEKIAEQMHKKVSNDMVALAQQAQQSGAKVDPETFEKEIYKRDPMLAGDSFADFASTMSGKDIAALKGKDNGPMDNILSRMSNKGIKLSVNQVNNLIDEAGQDSEKATVVAKHVSKAIKDNEQLAKGVGKNSQSVWWISQNCDAETMKIVNEAQKDKKNKSGSGKGKNNKSGNNVSLDQPD